MGDTESASSLADFVDLSVQLTGFSAAELRKTGLSQRYLDTVLDRIGADNYRRFLAAFADTAPEDVADAVAMDIARAAVWLWYLGVWPELSADTCAALGITDNVTYTVSARAYAEGLVWQTIGTAAPGTAAPGFGSWSRPPRPTSVEPQNAGRAPEGRR